MIPRAVARSFLSSRFISRSMRASLPRPLPQIVTPVSHPVLLRRSFTSNKSPVDEKMEELQELYATARDEFEIAAEETEKVTVYAAEDRVAAREELDNLKEAYQDALKGEYGAEVERRVGQRVRELENAVNNLEELAKQQ
ncbi:MAG: hypothetical protein M1834_003530 [Cirrosporium novae-zelandiae]|nr:MAG: hypothetical protein M1834_003530 [Cirrosporium novae-zelandiae]